MSQTLVDYIRRVGESINMIYKRLEEIEGKINTLSKDVNEFKALTETNKADISNLRENMVSMENVVSKSDFNDFLNKLTESFKELLQPIPKEDSELPKEGDQH